MRPQRTPQRRPRAGEPARIGKPGSWRNAMSSAFVITRRTVGEMRATPARIAQAASQTVAAGCN